MKKITQNEFICRAEKLFPKYNFSNSVYINNKTKIDVICPKHGMFQIRPDCLMKGTGCPSCGGTKKNTTKEFIEKAKFVHNNFFSYEKCEYTGSSNKIIVTCPIHGDFEVKANNHLNGCNCKKCQENGITHEITKLAAVNASTKKLTTEEFIEKGKKIHGSKYSFEKCVYVKSNIKTIITCPIHGDFEITPNHFLNKRGCPKCGGNHRLTTNEFIERLKEIHGEKFYYNKVIYQSTHKQVILTCPIHGDFMNTPANLLKGQGCPYCSESKLENEVNNFLLTQGFMFERQKQFDWLKDIRKLSLDFYLPEFNIAIECQGIQHFNEVKFFGGTEALNENKKRDEIKLKLCNEHGIKLLYFSDLKIDFPYAVINSIIDLSNEIQKYYKKNLDK